MSLIGLKNVHYAKLQSDTAAGAAYYAPKAIKGAMVANINPNSSSDTLFADDGPMESASSLGKIELELGLADLALDVQADLLGHTVVGGVIIRKSGDVAPNVAIGFQTLKSNGKYRYVWLSKGKFAEPEQKNETKKESVAFNTPTINGQFAKRDFDDTWESMADEDAAGYIASTGTDWFSQVDKNIAGVTLAADVTVTTVPANGATAVAVASAIVATMSAAIDPALAISNNFKLIKIADGSEIVSTVTIDETDKIVTIDPNADLTAATTYQLTIKSLIGLAADKVVIFTTA